MRETLCGAMKQPVHRLDEGKVLREFPLADLLDGWYFQVVEVSPGAYEAAGTDLWGREVRRHRCDPDVALAECVNDAAAIGVTKAPS
jgi:hypothetical protein